MLGRRMSFRKTVSTRSEYLAYQVLTWLEQGSKIGISDFLSLDEAEKLKTVQDFMAPLYSESYTKGIHDQDATKILDALVTIYKAQQLARYSPAARACALVYWEFFCPTDLKSRFGKLSSKRFRRRTPFFQDCSSIRYILRKSVS